MISEIFNPQLGHYVIDEDRRFPQLTEHPGYPVDQVTRQKIEAMSAVVDNRFRAAGFPLFVHLSEDPDHFVAQVTFPPEITIKAFTHRFEQYDGIQVIATPTYTLPRSESAVFARTARSIDQRAGGIYPEKRLQFGVCARLGICETVFVREFRHDEPKTLEASAKEALQVFDHYVVGNELRDYPLNDKQLENLRRMAAIFGGYYLLGDTNWTTRAPLDEYVEEHAKAVPDAKSTELIDYTLDLSVKVAKSGLVKQFRVGEEYKMGTI